MLRIQDLTLQLGEATILNGVSFRVEAGETVGIIGPNGSGKTTLFNCISGFHRAAVGQIYFKSEDISNYAPSKRARCGLGRVFQNFGVFREMTVEENVLTALESSTTRSRSKRSDTRPYLEMVCLETRAKEKAGSLSGGQMRLLEIVRAIAFGSELFLLDEPTAGVSPKMKEEIEEALLTLQRLGKTILIIEHDINFIQKLCQRIVVLDVGRVVLDGPPDVVRRDPRLQEIYFGSTAKEQRSAA